MADGRLSVELESRVEPIPGPDLLSPGFIPPFFLLSPGGETDEGFPFFRCCRRASRERASTFAFSLCSRLATGGCDRVELRRLSNTSSRFIFVGEVIPERRFCPSVFLPASPLFFPPPLLPVLFFISIICWWTLRQLWRKWRSLVSSCPLATRSMLRLCGRTNRQDSIALKAIWSLSEADPDIMSYMKRGRMRR